MNINEEIHPAQQGAKLTKALELIRKIGANEYVDTRNQCARDTARAITELIRKECADMKIVRQTWSM